MPIRVLSSVLLLLLVPTSNVAYAQSIGVKAGVTRSTIAFDNDPSLVVEPKPGVLVGAFVGFPLMSRLGLQAEVLFVARTVRFEQIVRDRMRYLEIPVVFRYRLFNVGGERVHAEGGADFAVLLSAQEELAGVTSDITEAIQPVDVAAVVGATAEWRSRWIFGVRYVHGLSDVYVAPQFPAKQRAIQIFGGFRIK